MARRTVEAPVKNAKLKAFALFDEGLTPTSPEIKLLGLKGTTVYNYYSTWQMKSSDKPLETSLSKETGGSIEETAQEIKQREKIPLPKERNLIWKCLACGATAPPDGKSYMSIIRQTCPAGKKVIRLIDTNTGEELANNIGQAQSLGLIPKKQKRQEKPKKQPASSTKMETHLPGDESVSGIEEKDTPDTTPSADENPPRDEKKKKTEGVGDEFVEGEALWIKAKISVKTLTYYQLFASKVRSQNHDATVTLGDFLDIVSDDYFKGRGLSLGLVKLNPEKKEE